MSRLRVYNSMAPPEPERIGFITLEERDDHVLLRAVNKHGKLTGPGNLLRIYPDGTYSEVGASQLNGIRFHRRDES